MSKISFFALGGIDENGKNCYVLEIDNEIFILDVGVRKPIISRLGIDTFIPSFNYLKKNKNKIKGVFISHVHDENFAALPWLLRDIPNLKVFSSKFSKGIITKRIKKYNISLKNIEVTEIHGKMKIGNVTVTSFSVAHSIPGTIGFCFQTNDGNIFYLTDYILNDNFKEFGHTDIKLIEKLGNKKTLLLISDSSKANLKNFATAKSKITNLIEPFIGKTSHNARIIIGAFDEEMTAIHEILQIAKKTNRPVALYGREYFELLNEFRINNPEFVFPKIIPHQKSNAHKNAIVIITGKGLRLYERFFRILQNKDVFMKLQSTDRVLTIMPPINGHEKKYTKVLDDIMRITRHILTITQSQFNKFQPHEEDLKMVLKTLKPKYFIPIRGLYRYLSSGARIAVNENILQQGNCFLLKNGQKIEITNGKASNKRTNVPDVFDVIIDGFGVGDISQVVIREREQLSAQGVFIISIVYEVKKRKLSKKVEIEDYGVFQFGEKSEIYKKINEIVFEVFEELTENNRRLKRTDFQLIVRKKIQKVVRKTLDKEPIIVPVLYEL